MKPVTPEARPAAPGALALVHEFLNSGHLAGRGSVTEEIANAIRLRHESGANHASLASEYGVGQGFVAALARGARLFDDFATAESARTWLAARGLLGENAEVSEPERRRFVDLRELLRTLAAANNGQPLDGTTLATLNDLAASIPLQVHFAERANASLRPRGSGAAGALGTLLALTFEAMRDGTFARLKRCHGDGCPHTFYDASRNRTGTWCAMSVCGNRTKVRSYQARRRRERGAGRGTAPTS